MKTDAKAGIITIAEKLGISPATVSRALRPETAHLVKPSRRQEILNLADSLRFTPNPGARSLRKGMHPTLTVVIPHDENVFFSQYYARLLSGILHAAAPRGWDVRIATLRLQEQDNFMQTLQHLGIDSSGIIYLAEPLTTEQLDLMRDYRRPFVILKSSLPYNGTLNGLAEHVVGVDNRTGATTAAEFLLQLGHRRIGLILGPQTSRDPRERAESYLQTLRKAGAEPLSDHIYEGNFSQHTGRMGLEQIIKTKPIPTAICCSSDEIAFGAIDAARLVGLRCPEDISIIGFDDGPWATATHPQLTTVRQPLADLAERAVALLVEMVNRSPHSKGATRPDMPASLVIRESTSIPTRQNAQPAKA